MAQRRQVSIDIMMCSAQLLLDAHASATHLVCDASGVAFAGLAQAASTMRLSSNTRRKCRDLDACIALLRHASSTRNAMFLGKLAQEWRGRTDCCRNDGENVDGISGEGNDDGDVVDTFLNSCGTGEARQDIIEHFLGQFGSNDAGHVGAECTILSTETKVYSNADSIDSNGCAGSGSTGKVYSGGVCHSGEGKVYSSNEGEGMAYSSDGDKVYSSGGCKVYITYGGKVYSNSEGEGDVYSNDGGKVYSNDGGKVYGSEGKGEG